MDDFRQKLATLGREKLLELVKNQDKELYDQVMLIEWAFANKLQHLTWDDGTPITGRLVSNEELSLLIDKPFSPSQDLFELGYGISEQKQIHVASDAVLWAKHVLGVKPRVYQILVLRDDSDRIVLRWGRRLGKSYVLSIKILHHMFTHANAKILVLAPMKTHVEVIFDMVNEIASGSKLISDCIIRSVRTPHAEVGFSNGSYVRFFTTGISSGGKATVARGQEAHMIVLDEIDYMHQEDLVALYAMLIKTAEGQDRKTLVGASTPTGQRQILWNWCHNPVFHEYWFPCYVSPLWDDMQELDQRTHNTVMEYRHEMEADWGEDAEGVYPRRYVDLAFRYSWDYVDSAVSARSFYIIGVDWNKSDSAGTNIVVLEVCPDNYEDPNFRGKLRVIYRQEIDKSEYSLTKAVHRLIELNERFRPKHIYVDYGYGEQQVELLHKYGVDHPTSGLKKVVKGVDFSKTIDVRDPATKQPVRKWLKPFMVNNLVTLLENEQICLNKDDEDKFRNHKSLYMQLISYIVERETDAGRPKYAAAGDAVDHAHDALILACFAYTENYGELMRLRLARRAVAISNEVFLPMFELSDDELVREQEVEVVQKKWGSISSAPISRKRAMTVRLNKNISRAIIRRNF